MVGRGRRSTLDDARMVGWVGLGVPRPRGEIDISHGQKSARNHVTNGRIAPGRKGPRDGRQEDTQDEWSTRSHSRLLRSWHRGQQRSPKLPNYLMGRLEIEESRLSILKKMDSHF